MPGTNDKSAYLGQVKTTTEQTKPTNPSPMKLLKNHYHRIVIRLASPIRFLFVFPPNTGLRSSSIDYEIFMKRFVTVANSDTESGVHCSQTNFVLDLTGICDCEMTENETTDHQTTKLVAAQSMLAKRSAAIGEECHRRHNSEQQQSLNEKMYDVMCSQRTMRVNGSAISPERSVLTSCLVRVYITHHFVFVFRRKQNDQFYHLLQMM